MLPYIKVYVGNGPETEIRKLESGDVLFRFPYFSEKLQLISPRLTKKQFTIQWKDDEDDLIIVTTDQELNLAMKEMEDSKQKHYTFYINLHEDEKKQSTTSEYDRNNSYKAMNHPGVICDVCNKNIQGFRYKCVECDDYDVCSSCESKAFHFEHCMLRIPHPITVSSHMLHHFKKFAKKIDYLGHKESSARLYHHTKRAKSGGACSYKRNMATGEQYAKCPFHPYMKSKSQESKDDVPNETQTAGDEQPNSNEQKQPAFETGPIPLEDLFGTLFAEGSSQKLLSTVLNKFLGIPTETETEASTSKKESKEEGDCKKQDIPAEKVSADTVPEPEKETGNQKSHQKETVAKKVDQPRVHFVDSTQVPTENQQINEPKNMDNNEKTETMDEWTIIDKNESSPHHRNTPSPAKECIADAPIEETVTKPSAPQKNQLYPSLPETNIVYHSNPVIQAAVEKMIAMGYSNTGGVLTYLLDAENGNIEKVLDKLERINC